MRPATAADVPALTRLLCRAFAADPVVGWVLRSDRRRGAALAWYFRLSLDLTLPHRWVFVTEDGGGTALWTPPGRWREGWGRQVWRLPGFVRSVGLRRLPAVLPALAALEARHPAQPHLYLFQLAVEPEAQGRGIGGALLRHGLDWCDERGVASYLESSSARGTGLYQRHGFRVVERHVLGGDGPPVWRMWRDPRS